jgi:hypothetical protein
LARYKVLGAVAHNVADSFTSSLNYASDDYVMGVMLTLARQTSEAKYFIDFVSGEHSVAFDSGQLVRVVPFYNKMFWDNVENQGSDASFVSEARLEVDFDLSQSREETRGGMTANSYECRWSFWTTVESSTRERLPDGGTQNRHIGPLPLAIGSEGLGRNLASNPSLERSAPTPRAVPAVPC